MLELSTKKLTSLNILDNKIILEFIMDHFQESIYLYIKSSYKSSELKIFEILICLKQMNLEIPVFRKIVKDMSSLLSLDQDSMKIIKRFLNINLYQFDNIQYLISLLD